MDLAALGDLEECYVGSLGHSTLCSMYQGPSIPLHWLNRPSLIVS